jgi:hypothetical protein
MFSDGPCPGTITVRVYKGYAEVQKAVENVVYHTHQLTDDIGVLELASGDLLLLSQVMCKAAGQAVWEAETVKAGIRSDEWCGVSPDHGCHRIWIDDKGRKIGPDWESIASVYRTSDTNGFIEYLEMMTSIQLLAYLEELREEQKEIWDKFEES